MAALLEAGGQVLERFAGVAGVVRDPVRDAWVAVAVGLVGELVADEAGAIKKPGGRRRG
jgi:hypothetical protein